MSDSRERPYKELVDDFIKSLDDKKLISNLTGMIFLDPIIIQGSTDPVEREFVQLYLQTKEKNPFTRQPMSISQLNACATDVNTKENIQTLINGFIAQHQLHPDIDKMKEIIKANIYHPEITTLSKPAPGPAEATEDDLHAMLQAMGDLLQENRRPQPRGQMFQNTEELIHLPRGFTIVYDPAIVTELNEHRIQRLSVVNLGFNRSTSVFNRCIERPSQSTGADIIPHTTPDNIRMTIFDISGTERMITLLNRPISQANIIIYFGDDASIQRGFNMRQSDQARHFTLEYGQDGGSIIAAPCAGVEQMLYNREIIYNDDSNYRRLAGAIAATLFNMCRDTFNDPSLTITRNVESDVRRNYNR